ncbi:transcriptional regulator [Bacillus pseudomycoides]|uniref:Transcriptional regulator n=1 Tax=Bacillus pseudomycoides TaxID=64104 RepID=A0AA91ZSH9_9BACI|nr:MULTISPECIES: helix-turn-helix transcriptional regulator [Bacillus]PEB56286.1 transcriptional regulator [Bacillus sp. AFS098217]PED81716.1 transcriptional regulator [Bacillus pseudomycoides]PEU09365.1 transcriptional regulator [Bacillus sp. AFS014408]PEU10644.1 transcriptional regulator [Bacillus sp. AFS019443]PFW64259.1 transcriptional regulator [Bacillus sp. AFS075034]
MIGENIYRFRKKIGLTLSELAEKSGISKSYLSNIERNINQNPSIQVMGKIALVLKVDLHTLIETETNGEIKQRLEKEWVDFVYELKKMGVDKEKIREYKILIDFIKWQNSGINK